MGNNEKNNAKNNGNNEKIWPHDDVRLCRRKTGDGAGTGLALVKRPPVKYRRFTGRRCALNTRKAIETSKEKARALNRRITGGNTKNRAINRTIAPVSSGRRGRVEASGRAFGKTKDRLRETHRVEFSRGDSAAGFPLRRPKNKARPKRRGCGRANVTLHLLPCTARAGNAKGIRSIPAIQGSAHHGRSTRHAWRLVTRVVRVG